MKKNTRELITFGLCIRPESVQDAEDIYKYLGCDPETSKYTGWNPYQSLPATIERIERRLTSGDFSYSWVIQKDGFFIGTIGAYDYHPDDSSIEIGYTIAREHWGNGYAKAAVKAVVFFLQGEPEIKSIRAWSHKDNSASRKVLLSAGFIETGTDMDHLIFECNADDNDLAKEASKYYIHAVFDSGKDYGGSHQQETITEKNLAITEEMMLIQNGAFTGITIDEAYRVYNGYRLTVDESPQILLIRNIGTKDGTCETGEYYGDDDHSRWNLSKYTLRKNA